MHQNNQKSNTQSYSPHKTVVCQANGSNMQHLNLPETIESNNNNSNNNDRHLSYFAVNNTQFRDNTDIETLSGGSNSNASFNGMTSSSNSQNGIHSGVGSDSNIISVRSDIHRFDLNTVTKHEKLETLVPTETGVSIAFG